MTRQDRLKLESNYGVVYWINIDAEVLHSSILFFLISESVDGDIEGLYLQNVQESEWKTDTIVRDTRARKVSSDIKQAWHEMK